MHVWLSVLRSEFVQNIRKFTEPPLHKGAQLSIRLSCRSTTWLCNYFGRTECSCCHER